MRRIGSAESPRVIAALPTEENGGGEKKERVGMLFHAAFVDSGEQLLLSESSHCLGLFFSRPFSTVPGEKNRKDLIFFLTIFSREYPAIRVHAWREGGSTACGSLQRHFSPSSDGPEEV